MLNKCADGKKGIRKVVGRDFVWSCNLNAIKIFSYAFYIHSKAVFAIIEEEQWLQFDKYIDWVTTNPYLLPSLMASFLSGTEMQTMTNSFRQVIFFLVSFCSDI